MNNILTDRIISLRELALFAFALFLLAVAPSKVLLQNDAQQQPVKATVPADEKPEVILKSA